MKKRARLEARRSLYAAALLALPVIGRAQVQPPAAGALPKGGQVVAGDAQIRATGAASLAIQQATPRAAIDWQSFDIGSAASVSFEQPSAQSVVLNRVTGADPSQIFGKLSANGQVFLSNPHGVFIAPGAQVDVGGLVATTHRISLGDFMAGRASFQRGGTQAGVLNRGRLAAAPGGYIALLAPEVRNEGVLVADAGTVALAAGEAITLNFGDTGRLGSITVTPAQVQTLIENRQAVLTDGGQVIIASRAADQLLGSVVNTGTVSASSMRARGGQIVIEADTITLGDGSQIEARGAGGGGKVLIGGDTKGAGPMHQARTVTMSENASIDASATGRGDGGTVVLWSNVHDARTSTVAQGRISARGGELGGNGGFVETSGASLKIDGVRVDTSAATGHAGSAGNWLLDPYDLTVDATAASTISTNLGTGNVTLHTTASAATGPGTINSSGVGDITINSAISWSSANTLTLDAYRNVNIKAPVTATGAGKVALIVGDTTGLGVGTTAGDYNFGLTANGFLGALRFTGTAGSGQSLSINAVPYTLIYSLANLGAITNLAGSYALAKPLNLASAGTLADAPVPSLALGATFTGLGNTVNAMTVVIPSGSAVQNVGLFGSLSNSSTLRDIGITNSNLTTRNARANAGLLVGINDSGTIKNAYATGTVIAYGDPLDTSSNSMLNLGLLAGRNYQNGSTIPALIDNVFSIGDVTAVQGYLAEAGGLVGTNQPATGTADAVISNAFSIANVRTTTVGQSRVGGLVGESVLGGGTGNATLNNVFSMGTVRGGSSADLVGGLAGAVGSNSITTNALSTNLVVGLGTNTGGLTGYKSATGTITNAYYDAETAGATGSLGTSQTTAQLQSGTRPTGFSASTWTAGSGKYPYLSAFFPNGVNAVTGTAYLSTGAVAVDTTAQPYAGGSAINTLGAVRSGANGYYYAITPDGTLPAGATSNVAATLTLSGAGSVSGLTYSNTPTVSNGNVTGINVREGVYVSRTARTLYSNLKTDLNSTLGAANVTSLQTTLDNALWQINATGGFSVDTALSHGGNTGLTAVGNLALNAAVTATNSSLMLSATGTVTDGASGAITANNLALLGGAVTLDGLSNAVNTVAASGVSSLDYRAANNVTVGSVGPLNTGVTIASIAGSTSTISGITATTAGGDVTIKAPGGITVGNAITSNAGDITLWSNLTDATTGGVYVQDNVTLDSRTAADRSASKTSTASGGGAITIGGGSITRTLASGTVVPAGAALNIAGGGAGLQLGTDTLSGHNMAVALYSGGGDIALTGRNTAVSRGGSAHGIAAYEGLTVDAGTTGSITMDGTDTVSTTFAVGLLFSAYQVGAAPTLLRTHDGDITLTANASGGSVPANNNAVSLLAANGAPITVAATGIGNITAMGTTGIAGGGDLRLRYVDILAASGDILLSSPSDGRINVAGGTTISLGSKAGSLVTSSSSNITLTDDSPAFSAPLRFETSGAVTLQPYGDNFTVNLGLTSLGFANTVSALTLGRDIGSTAHTDTINLNATTSVSGPISVYANTISVTQPLNSGDTITLSGSGTVSESGSGFVNAPNLLLNGAGNYTLNSVSNNIDTLV